MIKKKKPLLRIPQAFFLPKAKKLFTSARPVIMFHLSPYQRMFRSCARILLDIADEVYEDANFGVKTLTQAFKRIQSSKCKSIKVISNHDLVFCFLPAFLSRESLQQYEHCYCNIVENIEDIYTKSYEPNPAANIKDRNEHTKAPRSVKWQCRFNRYWTLRNGF